jgi:DNA-binding response OmpR family regulator
MRATALVDRPGVPLRTKLIEIVEIGKQLLIARGALTTFSIANDIAKYFAIIPAMFAAAESSPPSVRMGRHTVDLAKHTVTTAGGEPVRLTPTEWHLPEIERETHYLRQYMPQLRRKLEDEPAHPRQLLTEPGMGYRFQPAVGPSDHCCG